MLFETIVVGPLGVNCFILGDKQSNEGIVVDPGADCEMILAAIAEFGLKVKYIINTHGHFDHMGCNRALKEKTGAQLLAHKEDVPFLLNAARSAQKYGLNVENSPEPDAFLTDGMKLEFGRREIEVLHTPGHTQGGCCLYLANEKLLITGDTLFADSVGRTDLPGGDHGQLIDAIKNKLMPLPDDTIVWPGHGPSSTIGQERRFNPYLNE
ncbi:MBL fold metallo-hydrolase [Geomonas sp. Red69]|uniref:MBL fold metallo-hydrolase n=1 Tax=Geomonas diazotrophica TaxID=2843197 RepID=A0ABX8JE84_9BACT|nr:MULTISPECIES: MBL fold metallo-hydrolase [Geomonas]MBU5638190.1 MBL fold metallo-hydrolase [Geomonas diazotrophica]QWV95909.1 MBL fold metallo-hydrolase [Geomonas nitrogeniifigens]QXE84995.1 MBL fold metallo-hydrolase [Geomonas nitrogeniifigens]